MMRPRVSTRGEGLVRAHPWTANSVAWAFGLAFAVYEAALFLVSVAWLGGTESFAPSIVGQSW